MEYPLSHSQPRETQTQLPNPKQNSQQKLIPSQAEHQHLPWNPLEYSQNSAPSQPLGQVSSQENKNQDKPFKQEFQKQDQNQAF